MSYDPYSRIMALRAAAATAALSTTAGATNIGADDGASGAKFSTMQGFLTSVRAPGGSALLGYAPAQSGTVSRSVQAKLQDQVNVRDFGAVGDGVADDTAALQAAITSVAASGGELILPAGTYKITATLTMPFSTGWRIRGASKGKTIISQATANTGILLLNGDLTWGWCIEEISFTWATSQTAAQTKSVAILMDCGVNTYNGFFDWQIRRCTFSNGYRGIAGSAVRQMPLWSCHISNCNFQPSMTGASVFMVPAPACGQPNINIENCYINASNASEPTIQIAYSDSLVLRNVEWNGGAAPVRLLQINTCLNVTFIGCRSEAFNAGAVAGNPQLWSFAQANVTFIGCSLAAIAGTTSFPVAIFGTNGSRFTFLSLLIDSALTSGYVTAYYASEVSFIDHCSITGNATDNTQTYLGVNFAPKINLQAKLGDFREDVGDASKAMTSTSGRLQSVTNTLTANRSITLPPASGMVVGMEIEIVRKAPSTPGAFTLTVADPLSGQNYTLPASTNGFVRYRYVGNAYMMLGCGTMP